MQGPVADFDPFEDLNACIDAEIALSADQHAIFRKNLHEICGNYTSAGDHERAYISSAPALRAEALWLTLRKQ